WRASRRARRAPRGRRAARSRSAPRAPGAIPTCPALNDRGPLLRRLLGRRFCGRRGRRGLGRGTARLQRAQHRRSDVGGGVAVHHGLLGQDQVVALRLAEGAHLFEDRALQARQLLVATRGLIVLQLAARTLEVARPVAEILLGPGALLLAHGGAVLLQLL